MDGQIIWISYLFITLTGCNDFSKKVFWFHTTYLRHIWVSNHSLYNSWVESKHLEVFRKINLLKFLKNSQENIFKFINNTNKARRQHQVKTLKAFHVICGSLKLWTKHSLPTSIFSLLPEVLRKLIRLIKKTISTKQEKPLVSSLCE